MPDDDFLKQWDPVQDPFGGRHLERASAFNELSWTQSLSAEQFNLYQVERAEVQRLWEWATLGELLPAIFSSQEIAAVREALARHQSPADIEKLFGRPVRDLPQGFGFEPAESPIQLGLARKLEPIRGPLFDLICVKWDYCAHRDKVRSGLTGLLALLAFLISHGVTADVPLSGLIVGGVSSGYFDNLCECGPSKAGDR